MRPISPLLTLSILLVLGTSACSRQRGDPDSAATAKGGMVEVPAAGASEGPATAVAVAPEIRDACGLAETEAFFPYNSARLRASEDAALHKIAECFRDGPLAGQSVILVGRTDPRGSDEYNLVLGNRRAESVAEALKVRDLSRDQIQTSTRGEYDAKGTDEPGWSRDRRVNVELAR
ncbi:MAG: OmpA family protein [Polyangiaceae bacterium]|nr:OmpA family protein [Polyangiaceae bacterium]